MWLPVDCLEQIVLRVDDAHTLASLSCVNKACRAFTQNPTHLSVCIHARVDIPALTNWLCQRLSSLEDITLVGNLIFWSAYWRTVNFFVAPRLRSVTLLHPDQSSLSVSSMEEFVPLCPQLSTLRIMSGKDLYIGSSVSRYDIQHLEIVATDVLISMELSSIRCLRVFGHISFPECFISLDETQIEEMHVPTSVMTFCQNLPRLERLKLVWDGAFHVDFLHAPNLKTVKIIGGEWTMEWVPPCVKRIDLHDATITPNSSYSTFVGKDRITLERL